MGGDGESEDFQRLGKRELGRHAFEDRIPDKIARLVEAEDDTNSLKGVIPNLGRLLENDRDVNVAYLCDASAVQVFKIQGEGGHFCGYRNTQMLCLALGAMQSSTLIPTSKLTIPQLQEMIEQAWAEGHNSHGLIQTGGIKATRKHIGTSEAEALLLSLDIPCTGTAFHGKQAWEELLQFTEAYFSTLLPRDTTVRINHTNRPPIFLQRPNHSLTIVGFERTVSGKRRVLTFDPAFRPPSAMEAPLSETACSRWSAKLLLGRYRKRERYFKRYKGFETLTVDKTA